MSAARWFLIGQIPGLLLFCWFIAQKSFLQAYGDTTPVFRAAIFANVINWMACHLLVSGDQALLAIGLPPWGFAGWGTFGAGLAGSLANLVLCALLWPACLAHRQEGTTPPPSYRQVYGLGLPMGLQFLAEIGVFSAVSFIAARFGEAAVAAHQVALGLASFSFMGALGVSGATAVRVGRAIGEGRSPRRAGMVGIVTGGLMMTVSIVVFWLAPNWLVSHFTSDPEVVAIGVPLLRVAAVFQFFDGVQATCGGALRGAGDVGFPLLANLASHWLVGLPVALTLAFWLEWNTTGLWVGLSAGLICVALAMSVRFWRLSGAPIARV